MSRLTDEKIAAIIEQLSTVSHDNCFGPWTERTTRAVATCKAAADTIRALATEVLESRAKLVEWSAAAAYGDGSPMMTADRLERDLKQLIERAQAAETCVAELREALWLFREAVVRGTAGHHHPIWVMVADALGPVSEVRTGPEWKFVQPDNGETLAHLRRCTVLGRDA